MLNQPHLFDCFVLFSFHQKESGLSETVGTLHLLTTRRTEAFLSVTKTHHPQVPDLQVPVQLKSPDTKYPFRVLYGSETCRSVCSARFQSQVDLRTGYKNEHCAVLNLQSFFITEHPVENETQVGTSSCSLKEDYGFR